jgi:Aerotolerance regulator N-terminal
MGPLGLLYPGALYFFALVPALVIAYLARERPRQAIVSSVLVFRALRVMRGERFGGRPRFNWTFFLELLILCLAVLAMAGPYMARSGNPVAVVLDDSAAMQALTPSGKTRFETAVERVGEALAQESGSSQVTVYLTAPRPHQLGAIFTSTRAAASAIKEARAVDAPNDPAALTNLLAQLNADHHIGRIIYASYRPLAGSAPGRIVAINTGAPIANYAIGSFSLSRENFGAAALHARMTAANFSPTAQTLEATLTGDGKPAGHAQARVEPGEVATLEFRNLPPAQVYRVQLEPADGFMLDNVAYATGSSVKPVAVLFVSPTPADGESLNSIPGIAVTTRTPSAYAPTELADSDLAIFEYTAPKELPGVNALLVMPPPRDPVFDFAVSPAGRIDLTGWPATDPLTDGVNFLMLDLRSGEYFGEHPWMQPILTGSNGGLMLAGRRRDHRYVATGFNPFPYLGKRNLPMSILTLNMLGYLAGFGSQTGGFRTGEPWMVPAGVGTIVLPSGQSRAAAPGTPFTSVTSQGIYQLIGAAGQKTERAVNLADLGVSDLQNAPPIELRAVAAGAAHEPASVRVDLAPYILAAIIALIMLEAFLVYRRHQVLIESRP